MHQEKHNRIKNTDTSNRYEPSYEEVQKKAYEIYEKKGGDALENWLEAERQCRGSK